MSNHCINVHKHCYVTQNMHMNVRKEWVPWFDNPAMPTAKYVRSKPDHQSRAMGKSISRRFEMKPMSMQKVQRGMKSFANIIRWFTQAGTHQGRGY